MAKRKPAGSRSLDNGVGSRILQLYRSGKSLREIEGETSIPHETARIFLHSRGVQMRHVHAIYHEAKAKLDLQTALMLGLHAGDGYLSDGWGLCIAKNDKQMVKIAVQLARDVLGVEAYVEAQKPNCFIVKSGKEQVRTFFERYGFKRGKKAGIVRVPKEVMESALPEVWVGFLKGAFSSDGSFWFKRNWGQCRFEVSSPAFRDGFIGLAKRLGFGFRAYTYIHHGGHNKLPLHLACLGKRDEVKRWMEQVGSICDTHLGRYRRWKLKIGS